MKYLLINRENVVVDILDTVRYIQLLSSTGLVVACEENEGTGVIGSDANTHYTLMKADMRNNPDAVRVMIVEEVPSDVIPLQTKFIDGEFVARYTLEEAQAIKQEENKIAFASYLASHPMTWVDGKTYGITQEDQSEISLNLNQYQVAIQAGVSTPILEWHARHEECVPWTLEKLTQLSLAISKEVYPVYHLMQMYKTAIFSAESLEALNAIKLQYGPEDEVEVVNETDVEE